MACHIHLEMVRIFIGPVPVEHEHVTNALTFGCSKKQFDAMFSSHCHAEVTLMTRRKNYLHRIFFRIRYCRK